MTPTKILALTITTGLLVNACGPAVPNDQVTLTYGDQDQTRTSQTSTTQPPIGSTEGTMKTLADFEPITASTATITTSKGPIVIELYQDKVPLTVTNFLTLAKSGYYDGIVFHRVIPDFMAQVGDPLTKDPAQQAAWGTGGPGYTIADELDPSLTHNSEGIVSMANRGPNTGGSQFFITYEATPWLDGQHAVFGKVTQGMDILRAIEVGDTIESITYQ